MHVVGQSSTSNYSKDRTVYRKWCYASVQHYIICYIRQPMKPTHTFGNTQCMLNSIPADDDFELCHGAAKKLIDN